MILAVAVSTLLARLVAAPFLVASGAAACSDPVPVAPALLRLRRWLGSGSASGPSLPSISSVAGTLYVPIVGIINPSEISPAGSIKVCHLDREVAAPAL